MTIEQYCNMLGIADKKDLSDKQIEEWGRWLCPGPSINQIFILGTDLDKKNAIVMLRKAINNNKRLGCTFIIHESEGGVIPKEYYKMWLE